MGSKKTNGSSRALIAACLAHLGSGVVQSVTSFLLFKFNGILIIAGWDAVSAVGNFTFGGVLFTKRKQARQETNSEETKETPGNPKGNSKKILLGSCVLNILSLIFLSFTDGVTWDFRISKDKSSTAASTKEPEKITSYAYVASFVIPAILILICLLTLCLFKLYSDKKSSMAEIL
ncbi:uncharacterized protein [Centruroides vittatus]|uniref:uncharacterized protein n=1 Tax=Centruroides vittatus TaxID=120091 RepID=UPI0035106FC3